jgi:hypothetical protein
MKAVVYESKLRFDSYRYSAMPGRMMVFGCPTLSGFFPLAKIGLLQKLAIARLRVTFAE